MKTQNIAFDTLEELENLLLKHQIEDDEKLLLQCFCGSAELSFLEPLQAFLATSFPKATLLGTSTDGIIDNITIYDEQRSLLSCTLFEKTKLVTSSVRLDSYEMNSNKMGIALAHSLDWCAPKAVIAFSDGIFTNGETFVKGFSSVLPDVVLAGGMAGDNGKLQQTYVFDKNQIIAQGAICVALVSTSLYLVTNFNFDWTSLGKGMRVTKSIENRVYDIDGMRAVDVYAKYLGKELAQRLPQIGIEFPLVLEKDGMLVGRAVIAKNDDGSLTFAGNVDEGSIVRFAIGDVETILHNSGYRIHKFLQTPDFSIESVFIYSCMARRRFLQRYAAGELEELGKLDAVAGFFTYGEFFHDKEYNRLFNETMTLLALSENKQATVSPCYSTYDYTKQSLSLSTQHALAHLANAVSQELEELNETLEQRVQEAQKKIYRQAYIDGLTKLPNRTNLINRLDTYIGKVLLLLNIDDFTTINDFYGHGIGDEVLRYVAKTLQNAVLDVDGEVFKLPSDEFVVILDIEPVDSVIQNYIDHVVASITSKPFEMDGSLIYLNVTVAASLINIEKTGLVNADMALKLAKRSGKHSVIFHHDLMLAQSYKQNIQVANRLKYALEHDGILPFYQPIYNAATLEVEKYESLVRLRDKDGKIYAPYSFLEVSEKIKVYEKITQMMIDKTFAYFQKNDANFSLNLAFSDIKDHQTKTYLFEKMQEYDVASQLTIEILETEAIEDQKVVFEFANEVYYRGAKIAIDDFGSGFANFEYMTKIRSDIMKIDGSLIKNIDKDNNAKLITETIVDFAKKLGKQTVAEFVHSKEVYEIVKALGVDYVQGYYLGEPKESI